MAAWAWVGVLVLIGFLWYILSQIKTVLLPFIYAVIIVYILRPLVNRIEAIGIPRIWSVVISYLIVFIIIGLLALYIVPILVAEATAFFANFPDYLLSLRHFIERLTEQYQALKGTEIATVIDSTIASFKKLAGEVATGIAAFTINIFGGIFNLVLGPILAFYILKDLRVIRETLKNLLPSKYQEEGWTVVKKIDIVVSGFLKGQFLVALIVAILAIVSLTILRIDYAFLIGLFIGIFNMIPYFGPIIGAIPAVVVALGKSWLTAVIVIIVLFAIQQVDSLFISPNIISQQVNLHPVLVIFALLAGGTLFGLPGLLIAIPIAAAGKAVFLHFKERESLAALDGGEGS
jgi:predicted PurR-regulated permease PerM